MFLPRYKPEYTSLMIKYTCVFTINFKTLHGDEIIVQGADSQILLIAPIKSYFCILWNTYSTLLFVSKWMSNFWNKQQKCWTKKAIQYTSMSLFCTCIYCWQCDVCVSQWSPADLVCSLSYQWGRWWTSRQMLVLSHPFNQGTQSYPPRIHVLV